MRIAAVFRREQRIFARQRHQRHQMRAGGIAHHADVVWIDVELRGVGADVLHRSLHVIDGGRIALRAGLGEAVVDGEQADAMPGENGPQC